MVTFSMQDKYISQFELNNDDNKKLNWLIREVLGLWLVQLWLQRRDVRSWLFLSTPHAHSAIGYSMPFRSIWLAAISMTLMMKAIAKAQIRLFLTHVCRFFFLGWTERSEREEERKKRQHTVKKKLAMTYRTCMYLTGDVCYIG